MNSTSHIYQGVWIDWSQGAVLGATLTLSKSSGAILIAALAFWVTATASGFWSIAKFGIHQLRASRAETSKRHDGLYCQQQVILRNSGTPILTAWEFIRLSWSWRKSGARSFRRSFLLTIMALIVLAFFSAATILTSRVQKSSSLDGEVLVVSPDCGGWQFPTVTTDGSWVRKVLTQTLSASNYARDCYGGQNNGQCGKYTMSEIPWTLNANASCPFSDETCLLGNETSFDMDTGLLDSHEVLGLNAPHSERLLFRRKAVCSPMHLVQYAQFENVTLGDSESPDLFVRYYLGDRTFVNYTYQYDTHNFNMNNGYDLETIVYNPGQNSTWTPVEAISRDDADVSMFFLAASDIQYFNQVDDPIFSAHIETTAPGVAAPYYLADFWVNVIGCIDQYQYCKPASDDEEENTCTELTSQSKSLTAIGTLGLSQWQMATATHVAWNMFFSSVYYSVSGRGATALLAQESVFDLEQVSLPNNQWQLEVRNWFNISLAKIQQATVEYASGPTNLGAQGAINRPDTPIEKLVCRSQKVRDGNYANFSVLGICIIAAVGGVIILFGLVIDTCVGFLKRYFRKGEYSRLCWGLDEKLQLQRMAYEAHGWRPWTGGAEAVPITKQEVAIGRYDIRELDHPGIMPCQERNVASNSLLPQEKESVTTSVNSV